MDYIAQLLGAIKEFGLAVTLVILLVLFVLGLVVWVLKWVVGQVKDVQVQALEREHQLMGIIQGHAEAMVEHNRTTMDFRNEVKIGMQYQREEHEKMTEALDKLRDKIESSLERR